MQIKQLHSLDSYLFWCIENPKQTKAHIVVICHAPAT